jgi:hypothetical protein
VAAKKLSAEALRDLSRRAAFVFRGRVRGVGKSNLAGVPVEDRMALVQVGEIVFAPPALGDLTGKTVTVYLESARDLKNNDQATFFATSWHYGKNIGVIEIGRTDTDVAELRQSIAGERLLQHDEQVEGRIRRAVLVVSGKVTSTFRTKAADLPGRDEGVEWWEAALFVASVEKGRPPADLHIFFPVGGDREWGPVPKFCSGQTGVWLLGPVSEPDAEQPKPASRGRKKQDSRSEKRLMALDQLDYHASSALPRIRALLAKSAEK